MTVRRYALQDLTWVEFRDRIAEDPVILLPLGSQEQHGPQAPMGDFVLAERIALLAAERANAICAPALPFGYADFFRGAPGGIQLRAETFVSVLKDMITAFIDHGVKRLVICNGHSTNAPLISQVVQTLRRESGIRIPNVNLWRGLPDEIWRRAHGEDADAARGHGADPMTSVYMHFCPGSIRLDRMIAPQARRIWGLTAVPNFGGVAFDGVNVELPLDALEVEPTGVGGGDPAVASARAGKVIAEWLVDWLARFIEHFRSCDPYHVS